MKVQLPSPVLVDRRNLASVLPGILASVQASELVGLDCETEDSRRHEGLKKYCREKEDGSTSRTVFDMRRTVMTGFSVWPEGHDEVYYFNLDHFDANNILHFKEVKCVLDAARCFVAHNLPYEINAFRLCHGYEIDDRSVCSLQLCVSAYNPDTYREDDFVASDLSPFGPILDDILRAGVTYEGQREKMTPFQAEVFAKIVGKASEARHSYNGFVDRIALGYGLKQAVKSWFGHEMTTYKEALGGKVHMGQLTGEEVVRYGCDDAHWCVRLYQAVSEWLLETNPEALLAFLEQERPAVAAFAALWREGMRVDPGAISRRRREERANAAAVVRKLRTAVRSLLPFRPGLDPDLAEREPWYLKNGGRYRQEVVSWADLESEVDDLTELVRVRGATSNAWAEEAGTKSYGPNFSHYMPMRVLLFDLLGEAPVVSKGKVQSDGEARGRLRERLAEPAKLAVVDCLNELAGIEQRMKLFLTPYEQLVDPETGRLYPVVSSLLATRRMASRNPNPMQLSKRGSSTYIRGFFRADHDDHVIVSIDWRQIELVLIGEMSGDPEFAKAYGQLPYNDLHLGAAASVLAVTIPEMTEDLFLRLRSMTEAEVDAINPRILTNVKGERMRPDKAYGYWRTEVGKASNFEWPYSGMLMNVGEKMGWTRDQMFEATERYKARFGVAEAWRQEVIRKVQNQGYIQLPDGHRRYRFEATERWRMLWAFKWEPFWKGTGNEGVKAFLGEVTRAIQRRACNQAVNAVIQGSCATLAKRSVLTILGQGWDPRDVRFMLPIHDELLFSVRRDVAWEFIGRAKAAMCHHPDVIGTLKVDASAAVGLTFEPWDEEKAPTGQIEIDEMPKLPFLPPGRIKGVATRDEFHQILDHLDDQRRLHA